MNNFINKIVGDIEGKKEWKELEARAHKLPADYQVVYEEVKSYIWQGGTGLMDPSNLFKRMIELFEEGAAQGKTVLDITGSDVAAFVEKLTQGEENYFDNLRQKLNQTIAKKLEK